MEALALFFLFCIMCMMFVITCVVVAAAYFVCKFTRKVKRYFRPVEQLWNESADFWRF